MNKYKIGDRVRVINGIGKLQDAMRGRIGTVAFVHEIDGVQHCWVLIDDFDNPHKADPTIAFHYNQLAPWLNDSKNAKELAMSRYLRYKNNGYKKEVAEYCKNDIIATEALFNATRTVQTVIPKIKDVIYNDPATIVFWEDGTKTVVKCEFSKKFDPEKGLAMAFSKKMFGNKGNYYNVFKKWLPEEKPRNATIPICHEIQNMMHAINADKISKIKFECFACAHGMMFESGFYCVCPEPCVNGDKWRHKK
jgi:hypothetical protein